MRLKKTLKIISFQPSTTGKETLHQTRLLRTLSNLALNISRSGASTASLGSCASASPPSQYFFQISNLNFPAFSLNPYCLFYHYSSWLMNISSKTAQENYLKIDFTLFKVYFKNIIPFSTWLLSNATSILCKRKGFMMKWTF